MQGSGFNPEHHQQKNTNNMKESGFMAPMKEIGTVQTLYILNTYGKQIY